MQCQNATTVILSFLSGLIEVFFPKSLFIQVKLILFHATFYYETFFIALKKHVFLILA